MPLLKRRTALLVVLMLLASHVPVPAQSPHPPDPELQAGLALVREGDFEAAVLKLDTVVRRLLVDAARQKEAAQAYVYLGVAFLELGQELVARGKFLEALALDPQLRLDTREFSPQQIRVFESARAEAPKRPAAAGASPRPRTSPSAPPATAVAANQEEKKKKKRSPLIWILGGAAVVGAGAAAAGGGGGGGAQPTTTTQPVGNTTSTTTPPDTTTTTTQPGVDPPPTTTTTTSTTTPTTTLPGTPTTTTSTTLPTTTTTTTTPTTTTTTTPTTTTTTTTTLPSCTYSVGNATPPAVPAVGGNGSCPITTNLGTCSWTATTNVGWINLQNGTGTGSGTVTFSVDLNLGGARSGRVTLLQGSQPFCTVNQAGVLLQEDAAGGTVTFTSDLDLAGGQGQVVVDGTSVTFVSRGSHQGWIEATRGPHRVEATVVSAEGRPGTWRFRVDGPVQPGTLRVIAGAVVSVGAEEVVFRLSGQPGERVVFAFRSR